MAKNKKRSKSQKRKQQIKKNKKKMSRNVTQTKKQQPGKHSRRKEKKYQIIGFWVLVVLFIVCLVKGHDRGDNYQNTSTEKKVTEDTKTSEGAAAATQEPTVEPTPEKEPEKTKKPKKPKKRKKKKDKVVQKNPYDMDNRSVNVLITTNGTRNGLIHSSVDIQGTSDIMVYGGKKEGQHEAGKKIHFTQKAIKKAGKSVTITCPYGETQIASIQRQGMTPGYPGTIKLVWDKQGIIVINQLNIREYLYRVLPSEMLVSYPMEALKAQAVCARSFIYTQIQESSYEKYGADIDDTAAFQVYNTVGTDERAKKAVDRTAGEMIFDGDDVKLAYYYATSWGYSATPDEVWGGTSKVEYPSRIQGENGSADVDLSDEGTFYQFMTHNMYHCYDEDFSWYRWSVKLPADQLGAKLGIGEVKKIVVKERAKSGIMQKITVVGSGGRRTFEGQQQIREMMIVPGAVIVKQDGEKVTGQTMLPSATFYLQEKKKKKGANVYMMTGGGFGHGVGMSQTGASAMAKAGKNYRQILKFYYGKCKIW